MTGLKLSGAWAALAALALAVPAHADVKDGVDAWSRGDYDAAVAEWRAPAAQGDPDAQFNLGQAYRLGLGVEKDTAQAEYYYAHAAQAGHLRAADTYGLMLFQSGRREAALPYVQDAARRGDPRSQYLLGIARFNGEGVPRDWVRAYALLTLANSQGLPQAPAVIAQMDAHIPYEQRQQAVSLAQQMQQDADAARAQQLAAVDLGTAPVQASSASSAAPAIMSTPRVPQPIETAAVPASSAAPSSALDEARAALREARLATGTESPAEAGADYARPAAPAPVAAAPAPRQAPPPPRPVPNGTAASSGPWKVQLGAFGVPGNAQGLWDRLKGRPELAGKKRLLVPAGRLTKLQAGGFATRADASAACSRLKQAGQACIVTQ